MVLLRTRHIAAALLVYALPVAAGAAPVGTFEFIVADPGDQTDPAISGQYVVYSGPGPAGDGLDVFLRDIQLGITQTIAGGPGDQDSPDVYSGTAVYRTATGAVVKSWATDQVLRAPPPAGDGPVSGPVVHSAVAAWEQQDGVTGKDIVVMRYLGGSAPYVLRAPGDGDPTGDQRSPAVYDDLVAYVDDARQGSVWLHDSSRGPADWTRICDGQATSVSIGHDGARYVIAVARVSGATGEDIEIYDRRGVRLAALPAAGPQRNPHVAGEWVAFDDYSGAASQVAVWRWKTPPGGSNLVFVPHPTGTVQRLNDVSLVPAEELRVVFEDTASPASGRDIALYRLPVNPLVLDGGPTGWPITPATADCSDPSAVALATLELPRTAGRPDRASLSFDVDPPEGEDELPVLVCVHAEHVSSAWVLLGDDLVARPDDFEPHVVELSRPAEVEKGEGRLSASIEGKPGARLVVRVLPDPSRAVACSDDDDGHDRRGDGDDGEGHGHRARRDDGHGCRGRGEGAGPAAAPTPPDASAYAGGGGCGNAGALASLAPLAVLLARRRLRA